jgi:UDP-N-acetylmuramyl pentapeptide phosphotransferase/UDP-N-acetylglucosamine-1-phosphate transferase
MSASVFLAPALAAGISTAAVWLLTRRARGLPVDIPNRRSLHSSPVPRAGGYAVWSGFLPAALLYPPAFPGGLLGWLPAFMALAAVSAVDDMREVRVVPRLAVHGIAALWSGAWLAFGAPNASAHEASTLVLVAAIAFALAWSSNLYNFMDGNDGLAASMGAIGFGAYALAPLVLPAASAPGPAYGTQSAPMFVALVASILPFLAVNLPRASMFLGDVGAVPLGFIAGAFGAAGVIEHAWPGWFPLLVFLPFIADATLTLARRLRRRERVWEGHRGHFYQRLHQLGAGHAGTLIVYVVAMLGAASTALACLARQPDAGWWALAAWVVVVCMLFATIDYHWHKKTNISAHSPP